MCSRPVQVVSMCFHIAARVCFGEAPLEDVQSVHKITQLQLERVTSENTQPGLASGGLPSPLLLSPTFLFPSHRRVKHSATNKHINKSKSPTPFTGPGPKCHNETAAIPNGCDPKGPGVAAAVAALRCATPGTLLAPRRSLRRFLSARRVNGTARVTRVTPGQRRPPVRVCRLEMHQGR